MSAEPTPREAYAQLTADQKEAIALMVGSIKAHKIIAEVMGHKDTAEAVQDVIERANRAGLA